MEVTVPFIRVAILGIVQLMKSVLILLTSVSTTMLSPAILLLMDALEVFAHKILNAQLTSVVPLSTFVSTHTVTSSQNHQMGSTATVTTQTAILTLTAGLEIVTRDPALTLLLIAIEMRQTVELFIHCVMEIAVMLITHVCLAFAI